MTITAAQFMTSPAITVMPQTGVVEIARLLVTNHISAVPVCEPDGKLAGIVSEADILRPFRESAHLRRQWSLNLLAAGYELSQDFLDYLRDDTRTAADLMMRRVITASEHATLSQLAELMVANGVKRIPILRDQKPVGIVSRADIVRALASAPAMLV